MARAIDEEVSFEPVARMLQGPRWLATPQADGAAESVVAADGVWISTATGLAQVTMRSMSLVEKAALYSDVVDLRHDRYGLVADCSLAKRGDVSVCQKHPSDNDGLWTGMYLAGLVFEYGAANMGDGGADCEATTGSIAAKERAWRHFGAIEKLFEMTGVKGLLPPLRVPSRRRMARSFARFGDVGTVGGLWYNSSVFDGWVWKADTSSDEVTGHYFVLPLVFDLLASNASEKARVAELVCSSANYIVDNDFYLIDISGCSACSIPPT
jgi:hypothetical protein